MLKKISKNNFFPCKACSKFTLSLTGPDFTAYKVEDPFKRLGPIAIFSARRHWTAPRNVRLQKGSSTKPSVDVKRQHCNCNRSGLHSSSSNGDLMGTCDVCTKYTMHSIGDDDQNVTKTEGTGGIEYGFHLRGDAPVIVSYVEHNSLADVSFSQTNSEYTE